MLLVAVLAGLVFFQLRRPIPPVTARQTIAARTALPGPRPKMWASCGAHSHMATPKSVPTTSGGMTAMYTVRRMSCTRSSARNREMVRMSPVSAPSSAVLDSTVNRPMADTKAP